MNGEPDRTDSADGITAGDAPPMAPGARVPATRPPIWPNALGVTSIVWALLLLAGGACDVLLVLPVQMLPAGLVDALELDHDASDVWTWWMVLVQLLGMGLTVLLLVAGVGLVRRRPGVRWLCLFWAWAAIVLTLIDFACTWWEFSVNWEADTADMSEPEKQSLYAFSVLLVGGFVMLVLAWPVFFLFWFHRSKVKQQMAGWPESNPDAENA